ncbi:anti-sigma factor antagonist [Anaerolineales bacterium HSG25]|nr:anti-sigma factor antagonist [Anaerolineales bacterium HSG25]
MDINIKTIRNASVVEMIGDLDGSTAAAAQEKILPLVEPGCKVVLDMTRVPYMSSAGLRVLLLIYRKISGSDGTVVLVGLSEELQDTMSVTGFLDFFTLYDDLGKGLDAVNS